MRSNDVAFCARENVETDPLFLAVPIRPGEDCSVVSTGFTPRDTGTSQYRGRRQCSVVRWVRGNVEEQDPLEVIRAQFSISSIPV